MRIDSPSLRSWMCALAVLYQGCTTKTDCDAYSLDPACLSTEDTGPEDTTDTQDSAEPDEDLQGTISIQIVMPDMGGLEDNCTGTITIQYNQEDPGHEIQGTFDCTWETPLGEQMAAAAGDGVIEGTTDGENNYSGTAWYGPIESAWTGTTDENNLLAGAWSGHQEAMDEVGLPAIDHSGEFEFQLP